MDSFAWKLVMVTNRTKETNIDARLQVERKDYLRARCFHHSSAHEVSGH